MARERYCRACARTVKCREVRTDHAVELHCRRCERKLGTHYGHIVIQ